MAGKGLKKGQKIKTHPHPENAPKKEGRPSIYYPEICDELLEHFEVEPFENQEVTLQNGQKKIVQVPNRPPTFEGFAWKCGITHATLIEWTKVHPEFLKAWSKCKDKQKEMLVQGGLLGYYSTQFAIFYAKNVTDLRDKTEIEHTGMTPFLAAFQGEKEKI